MTESRFRAAALAIVTVMSLAACASGPQSPSNTPFTAGPTSPPPTTAMPTTEPPATETPERPVPTETTIAISVNGTTVTGVLQSNAATASLLAQLPLELSFVDYGGQEKIAGLPAPLVLDGMPSGGSAEPGTIGYYAPDQALVLYYDSVGYYDGIIPLGTFDDVATVQNAPAFVGAVTAGGAE
ncbi:cyclophilin-like fold protein [Agreia sp. PsM10]|uniref:cyclophilin-like fold protein n=1 Tax=Agreia sp. PsM10 TaxID=3030533 RepID=UPI00263BDEDC|nr:cyclophilin-like fold protein [Agreia sp. PsM10]MDN4640732.1 cyclophilin-like fold protein [Agreia sp. PsM10]